jgi:4-hydroxybenzoate polyprenyltransferase
MAVIISVSVMLLSLLLALSISRLVTFASLMYLVNSLGYSLFFKKYSIVDAIVIAIGFVIRAVAGCFAINVVISPWLILCVFLLALVLAFGKRRKELLVAKESRASLSQYTIQMSDSLLNLSVSMFLMSYALYTVSVNFAMMITLPFAFFGVFRYVQLVHLKGFGEETELILMDKSFIVNFSLWILVVIFVLYGGIM